MKPSTQKLIITRNESEGNSGIDSMVFYEVQRAITKIIPRSDSGFLVRFDRYFIFEDKVLIRGISKKNFKAKVPVDELFIM